MEFGLRIKNIGRGTGRCVVSAAAYRSGIRLYDEEQGMWCNYERKDDVVHSVILLPENAPARFKDRTILWNEVEDVEKQPKARFAREWQGDLPNDIPFEQAKVLVMEFAQSLCDEGMVIDVSIHWKQGNHHFHLLGTTRPFNPDGSWSHKEQKIFANDRNAKGKPIYDPDKPCYDSSRPEETAQYRIPIIDPGTKKQKINKQGRKQWERVHVENFDWNKKEKIVEWRKRYEVMVNRALEKAGIDDRVDCRSYADRGELFLPTIHMGQGAWAMERRGIKTDRGRYNEEVLQYNSEVKEYLQMVDELKELDAEIEAIKTARKDVSAAKEKYLQKFDEFNQKKEEVQTLHQDLYGVNADENWETIYGRLHLQNRPTGFLAKISGDQDKFDKARYDAIKRLGRLEQEQKELNTEVKSLLKTLTKKREKLAYLNPEIVKTKSKNDGVAPMAVNTRDDDDKGMRENRTLLTQAAKEEEENKRFYKSL